MEPGVFASLVTEDRIGDVVAGIEAAVVASFAADLAPGRVILVHAGPRVTHAETKRRADICVNIVRALRGDLKWGLERILDALPAFLRKELDGEAWEPDARRAMWTAG